MSTRYEASCDCGFTATHTHRAYVDRALRVHSCEKWTEKIAGQQRHAARMAGVDRTPKPCLHKIANHQHGTRACYVLDRCRCEPCAESNRVHEAALRRQKAYGRYDKYVPADEARAHVRVLMDQGMGLKRIVAVSGVSQGLMWKLVYGKRQADGTQVPTRRVLRITHDRIMAVTLDLADGAIVDNTGTTRRLQALVALGWSQRRLAHRLGIHLTNLGPLVHGQRAVVVKTAKDVAALYDELSMKLPPNEGWHEKASATRARTYAKGYGWLPPLAWDDDLIDDPDHQPLLERDPALAHVVELDEAAIWRRMHGDKTVRLSKVDAAELVARWVAAGRPLADLERVAGIKPERHYRIKDQEDVA